jgi:hypothetical protein
MLHAAGLVDVFLRIKRKKRNMAMTSTPMASPFLISARRIISPTHKRTEGRAPVWGPEFARQVATRQGGVGRNHSHAERDIVVSGDCAVTGGRVLLLSRTTLPNPLLNLFKPSRTISNLRPKNLSREFDPAAWI